MVFGLNNYIPGYQFSPMIWSVCSPNPFHNLNLMWNDSMMKLQCDALMYQSPTISGAQGSFFPLFGGFDSSIPNMLAQQTFMQYQQQLNNWWSNPSIGGMNNSPLTNPLSFWGNSPFGNNNGTNVGGGAGETVEKKEINSLKSLFEKIKQIDGTIWTNERAEAYKEALKKSSDQEKIEALKNIINDIDENTVKKAVLANKKDDLTKAGYNFEYLYGETEDDKSLKTNLESAHQDLSEGKIDKICQYIANDGESGAKILRNLSYWNNAHPSDKGILGMIADKIPNTERTNWKAAIHNITMQLVTKSTEYGSLSDKKDAIKEDLKKIDAAFDNGKSSTEIKSLVNKMLPKFNELYLDLRILEAQKINKGIRETFKLDAVSENIVLDETKSDLESEGFSNFDIKAERINKPTKTVNHSSLKNQPADAKLTALENADLLEEADVEGVYSTKTGSSNAPEKFYGVSDNKLVEFVGVKSADEITEDTPTKEIKDTKDIEKYTKTVTKIDELIDSGLIEEMDMSEQAKGIKAYRSIVKKGSHQQHFIIMDNELAMIKDDKALSANGWVDFKDGSKKHISKLTASEVKSFNDDEIYKKTPEVKKETDDKGDKKDDKVVKTTNQIVEDEVKEDFSTIGVEGIGKMCAKHLIGSTDDDEAHYVEYAISKLEKNDVLIFMKGYFDNSEGGNGFFEQIARESDERWTNKKMVPMMKLVLDAIPEEYHSSNEYIEMRAIYRDYAKVSNRIPDKHFTTRPKELGYLNALCANFGNSKLDDFDDYLSDLLEKINTVSVTKEEKENN